MSVAADTIAQTPALPERTYEKMAGYLCPDCGQGLPNDELCPCRAGPDETDESLRRGMYAKLARLMRAVSATAGEARSRKPRRARGSRLTREDTIRIGNRDGWICGICQDPGRPVIRPLEAIDGGLEDIDFEAILDSLVEIPPGEEPTDLAPADLTEDLSQRPDGPLAAQVDHILPGGTDDDSNLQIAHAFCNNSKSDGPQPSPEYARANLSRKLSGTPIPSKIWQREFGKLPPMGQIDRGRVALEPSRLLLRYRYWRWLDRHRRRWGDRRRNADAPTTSADKGTRRPL